MLAKKYAPHEYQKTAIKLMISQAAAGMLLDPGLGKTSISLGALNILKLKKLTKGALVIAPLRAAYNVWPDEIAKWAEFNHFSYTMLHGPDKLWSLNEADADLYIMNPEGVPWLAAQLANRRPETWPFDVLIVDESTKFKTSSSQRFKALRSFVGKFKRRYILTGTPTPNGLLDLFGQIFILDLGNTLGRYITQYKNEYFYSSGWGGFTWVPRINAMKEITEKIAPLILRMRHEDYLTLPPLINDYRWLELPAEARNHYREMEDNFIITIGDADIISPSAAAAGGRCRQIINGAIYINEEHDWKELHETKIVALKELIEELSGQPLLIFYEFIHDRERIIKALDWPALGHGSQKKDSEHIAMFNAGALPGLIAHPASAGHGLNLQGSCAHVVWFGLTWNLEYYDQAIRRVWRQGNEAPKVVIHHLCVKDSLDEVVLETLYNKNRKQTDFMEGVRKYRLHSMPD